MATNIKLIGKNIYRKQIKIQNFMEERRERMRGILDTLSSYPTVLKPLIQHLL